LAEEIALVRKADNSERRIMLNFGGVITFLPIFWGNILSLNIDIFGFDLYFKRPYILLGGRVIYKRNFLSMGIKKLAKKLKEIGKQIWIAELQAEPWESDELVSKKNHPSSFLPEDLKRNFEAAEEFSPDNVLFWGFEYWLWRKRQGDERYWYSASQLLSAKIK
jgi:hypothetical protein